MTFGRGEDQTQLQASWPGFPLNCVERRKGEGNRITVIVSGADGAQPGHRSWRGESLSQTQHPQLSRRVAGTRWGLCHGVRDCENPRGGWPRPCLRRSCSSANDAQRYGLQFVLTGSSRRRFPET